MKQRNSGFTLVEVVIVVIIIAILAAIIVPITLGMINDSKEADAKLAAKEIMNAVQSEFNNLAANSELWYSISKEKGIILNKDRKNYGNGLYGDNGSGGVIDEFKNGFININNTIPVQNIFKKIENADKIDSLYVGAGNAYKYYSLEEREKMYTAYVIIFQLKGDDEPVYFYDGKEISTKWPFSSPQIKDMATHDGQKFYLSDYNDVQLQLYALKITKSGVNCDAYWRNTLMKLIEKENK